MTVPIEPPTTSNPASRSRRAAWRAVGIVALAVALVVVGGWSIGAFASEDSPGPLVPRVDPVLPDLAMGPIEDVAVGTTPTGEQRLRFAATIVNIGDGPFLVRARRPFIASDDWTVDQWIAERSGGFSSRATRAGLIFGGDGHNHWHVRQVEVHQLETLDGEVLGRLVKQGFCFFDTDVYDGSIDGSPELAHWGHQGCASSFDTRVRMGLSVGWGDKYPWHLVDERIDVTDIPDGIYRLREIADPNDEFEESDETNNETWVDIELSTTADGYRDAQVVRVGPAPEAN